MKIFKNSFFIVLSLVLSLGLATSALAQDIGVSAESSVNVTRAYDEGENGVYAKATTTTQVRTTSGGESDRTMTSSRADSDVKSTTTVRSEVAEDYRSAVSLFVRNLLSIANRGGGIGAEVRVVAREQEAASTTTIESMNKVEARSKFKTFLIGSDYRNLGMIRSEISKTDKRIVRLQAAASSSASVSLRADIATQIKLLQDDQAKVTAFVEAHDGRFSLLGWFVKIFVR